MNNTDTRVAPGTLTLATITGESTLPDGDYYVTSPVVERMTGYHAVVVSNSDPRIGGRWNPWPLDGEVAVPEIAGLDRTTHYGWWVPDSRVTYLDAPTVPETVPAVAVGDGRDTHAARLARFASYPHNAHLTDGPTVRVVQVREGSLPWHGRTVTLTMIDASDSRLTFYVSDGGTSTWVYDVETVETAPAPEVVTFGDLAVGEAFRLPVGTDTDMDRTWIKTDSGSAHQITGSNDYNGRLSFFGTDNPVERQHVAVAGESSSTEEIDAAVRAERDRGRASFEAWKENATEVAHQYANDNSLCGEFDRCMEEIGLPTREREYTVTLTMNVTASDEDAAQEEAEERASSEAWRYVGDVHVSRS